MDDLISRQAAIEVIDAVFPVDPMTIIQKGEPMSDLIDRQAAIDALDGGFNITGRENAETIRDYINGVAKKIRELPSAERHGRWIENETSYADPPTKQTCNCSICGQASIRPLGDWCRWCGSRMDLDGDTE